MARSVGWWKRKATAAAAATSRCHGPGTARSLPPASKRRRPQRVRSRPPELALPSVQAAPGALSGQPSADSESLRQTPRAARLQEASAEAVGRRGFAGEASAVFLAVLRHGGPSNELSVGSGGSGGCWLWPAGSAQATGTTTAVVLKLLASPESGWSSPLKLDTWAYGIILIKKKSPEEERRQPGWRRAGSRPRRVDGQSGQMRIKGGVQRRRQRGS